MGTKSPTCTKHENKQKNLSPSALSKKDAQSKQGLAENNQVTEPEDLILGNEGGETLFLQLPKLLKSAKSHKPRLNKSTVDSPVNNISKKQSLRRAQPNKQESLDDMFSEDTTRYDPNFQYSDKSMAIFEQRKEEHIRMLKAPSPPLIAGADDTDQSDKQLLQLALVMDSTESMSVWLKRAKDQLTNIIDSVVRDCDQKVRCEVCFVGYRDINDVERFSVLDFTDDIEQVKQFIENCTAYGGDDIPEDLQGGLKMLLCQRWKANSIKKAVLIVDEPGHGKQYMENYYPDDFPQGNPENLTIETLTQELADKDIQLTLFQLNDTVGKTVRIMKEIHTGLEHFNWSNTEILQTTSIEKKFSKIVSDSTTASVLKFMRRDNQ